MKQQQNNSPGGLAIRILSVIGGFLAAICFIAFLALTDIARSNTALAITAIGFIIVAIAGNRAINQLFLDTSITALYVAGCITLCYAMAASHWNIHLTCLLFMFLAVATFRLSRGVFFPFLAVLLFNSALTWFTMENMPKIEFSQFIVLLMGIAFFLLNLFEARFITTQHTLRRLFRPLHAGFFVSFICGLVWISGVGFTFDRSIGILSIFVWIGIVILIRQAIAAMEVKSPLTRTLVYIACLALLVPTLFAPALSGALLLLLICFCYGYKVEMGTSLIVFIYTVGKYYYDLQLTLLAKSVTLFLTGIVLLTVWHFFTKYTRCHEEI